MRLLIYILFVGIVVIGLTSFFGFGFNDDELINDFEKQSEFLTSKNEPVLQKSLLESERILKINKDPDPFLNDSYIYQKPQSTIKSSITTEIIEANKLYDEQRYLDALLLYDDVLLGDPSNLYALNGKAGTLLSLKQFDESVVIFENILLIFPDNTNALNGVAYAYHLKALSMRLPGILYDSVYSYEKTLIIDPKNLNALVGIASVLMTLERYDESVNYYKEALSIDPDNKNAKNGLFSLWITLGNNEAKYFYLDSAIVYFDKVLEIDSSNLEALLAKASAYTEWGKSKQKYYSTSEIIYTTILEYYANNTMALTGMGYVLSEKLEFEKALLYYNQALDVDPTNINAQKGKSFVLRIMN